MRSCSTHALAGGKPCDWEQTVRRGEKKKISVFPGHYLGVVLKSVVAERAVYLGG